MTAKQYLNQAFWVNMQVNSKMEQIAALRELAAKATCVLSETPRSASPDLQSMEKTIAKIIDMEEQINCDIDALVDLKQDIAETIKQVGIDEQQIILEQRYLCFKPFGKIASELSFSPRQVYRIHEEALKKVAEIKKMAVHDIECQ